MQLLAKKNKFTYASNTPNSITEISIQAINSENNSSQYFTLNDSATLSYGKNNYFSVSYEHMEYHFDELQTFLSNCPNNFQVLGISESIKTDI